MKKILSVILSAMFVAVLGLNLTSCDKSAEARLQMECKQFNDKEAPMDCGGGIVMEKVSLNDASKLMVFDFTYTEDEATVADLKPFLDDAMKATLSEMKTDPDTKKLFSLLKEAGYGIDFVITGKQTKQDVHVKFNAQEVAALVK